MDYIKLTNEDRIYINNEIQNTVIDHDDVKIQFAALHYYFCIENSYIYKYNNNNIVPNIILLAPPVNISKLIRDERLLQLIQNNSTKTLFMQFIILLNVVNPNLVYYFCLGCSNLKLKFHGTLFPCKKCNVTHCNKCVLTWPYFYINESISGRPMLERNNQICIQCEPGTVKNLVYPTNNQNLQAWHLIIHSQYKNLFKGCLYNNITQERALINNESLYFEDEFKFYFHNTLILYVPRFLIREFIENKTRTKFLMLTISSYAINHDRVYTKYRMKIRDTFVDVFMY